MDNPLKKQLTTINEKIGAVVQASQQMEFAISLSLTLLKRLNLDEFDDDAFDSSMDIFSTKTLGALLKELRKQIDLKDVDIEALKVALDERNYIIHRFFNENVELFATRDGREQCLKRIIKARRNIHPGFLVLDNTVAALMKLTGMDPVEVQAEAEAMIEI